MKRPLFTLALAAGAALMAPSAASAQDGGWWAPVAEVLGSEEVRQHPVCRDIPDLPACRAAEDEARDGDAQRDTRDRTRERAGDRTRQRDGGWDANRRQGGDDRWEDSRDDDDARRGNGPPFCRNGQGHPVHGRQWCRDKGWDDRADRQGGWQDVSWEDVIFGRGDADRERTRSLDRGGLLDVLGDVVLGRLERQGRSSGDGALTGRWVEGRTRVLQVRAGDRPLAELLDADRDGRVDRVLLHTPR